ncbi:MAG: hypothetical protein IJL76_02770 [Bacilli bacterium]|nr:hypothetical protein [Bacilli bacterium]
MNEVFYYNDLFDIYGELLTDKQKDYFKDYYFDNLSYGEIGEKYSVSRNAVFKQLKMGTDKLEELESKLHIYDNLKKIENGIDKIDDKKLKEELKEMLNNTFKN